MYSVSPPNMLARAVMWWSESTECMGTFFLDPDKGAGVAGDGAVDDEGVEGTRREDE